MSRVTSKLQVTVPKAIADRFAIHPGDEIDWLPAGEVVWPSSCQRISSTTEPMGTVRAVNPFMPGS